MRQHNLALEECWVTNNGWFRLFTTFVGMTVTDCWFLRERPAGMSEDKDDKRRIVEFAGDLAESLLEMAERI